MRLTRPIVFWMTVLAAFIALAMLLHGVLLPFVAGMVLAYLLDPLATRLEHLGINRILATLFIVGIFIVGSFATIYLAAPFLINETVYLIKNFPLYLRQLQALAINPDRPWLTKIIGEGLGYAEHSIGELTTFASDWLGSVLRSVWTGGEALISIFLLALVTPIVACYLNIGKRR